jgi:hypothetical protein
MLKITKTQAIAKLKRGVNVTVYRNNVNPENPLGIGIARLHQDDLLKTAYVNNSDFHLSASQRIKARFNRFLDSFEYYNHDADLGNKTFYAISE